MATAKTPAKAPVSEGFERLSRLSIESCRAAIRAKNRDVQALIRVLDEPVLDSSAQAKGPLRGIPFTLKDVWDTKGITTTGGSWRHRDRVPSSSAPVYDALIRAGAVMLGKSNLSDLAFSAESDNHICGPTKNPFDPTRTAGGSSGGAAAAVANGMAAFDWGTDFGGSIRTPAAFCGITGLRLSNEMWPVEAHHFPRTPSRFWSFCGMGPMAKTVAEVSWLVESVPELRRGSNHVAMNCDEVVLYEPDRLHMGDWSTFGDDARALFARCNIRTVDRKLPSPRRVNRLFTGYLCAHSEEFADPEEMTLREGVRAVFAGLLSRGRLDKAIHPNTAILFLLVATGRVALFRDRARWEDALATFRRTVADIWAEGRLIVSPTCTMLPPKHGRAAFTYGLQSFTKFGNLTDSTSMALPFGTFPGTSLPRSLQILGPPGSERAVCALGARLERAV
jgi:Asp-tRNA(Asn)/Glu-tRNA(Gln) amidotransferase A subunit family amidase